MRPFTELSEENFKLLKKSMAYFRKEIRRFELPEKNWKASPGYSGEYWYFVYFYGKDENKNQQIMKEPIKGPHGFGHYKLINPDPTKKFIEWAGFTDKVRKEEPMERSAIYFLIKFREYADYTLSELFFKNKYITLEKANNSLSQYEQSHIDYNKGRKASIRALKNWVNAIDSDRMQKIGKILDENTKYLPKYTDEVPLTLYRAVLVEKPLLDKVRNKNKPLVLHINKYSSWTLDQEKAGGLVDVIEDPNLTPVILKKTFKPEDIMLNVEEAAQDLGIKETTLYNAYNEKEVIIKTNKKTFTFDLSDVLKY